MNFKHSADISSAIITAKKHILSSHRTEPIKELPKRVIIFCIGSAMDYLKKHYETKIIMNSIPKFIGKSECLQIIDYKDVCFVHGGYGSPAIADTVETLCALGVKEMKLVGMCGGFSTSVNIGDVIIPTSVLSEEGTSRHYYEQIDFISQTTHLASDASQYFKTSFNVHTASTVTMDAIYRQTFYKEAYWRDKGCIGVDMEASAFLAVSQYCQIKSAVVLLVSDKHPLNENDSWYFGNSNFKEIKNQFISQAIEWGLNCD